MQAGDSAIAGPTSRTHCSEDLLPKTFAAPSVGLFLWSLSRISALTYGLQEALSISSDSSGVL